MALARLRQLEKLLDQPLFQDFVCKASEIPDLLCDVVQRLAIVRRLPVRRLRRGH